MGTFVIAEAGVNHDGSLERALELVEIAHRAGADAVKFQTFRANALVVAGAGRAEYQKRATGDGDQRSMLAALELSEAAHVAIAARCAELGIEFMSTAFDEPSMAMLARLGMRRIKVPSGEVTNRPFLRSLAAYGRPLILSTGMCSLDEVAAAIGWLDEASPGGRADLTVLHCTSSYPAEPQDANLHAMRTMAQAFGRPVGYSDHTRGIEVSIAAVALGATVVEKHFTVSRSLPGPDHAASLEPAELAEMVRSIRSVEHALGDGTKAPRPVEIPVRALVRRSVATARALQAGTVLSAADLTTMRPGTGIPPAELDALVGRRLVRAVEAGQLLERDALE